MSTNRDHLDSESRSNLHNSRGIDLAERGWLDEAIKEFKNAIKSAPHNAQGYDNLGTVYADKGDYLNALSSYTQALALEPENPIALHNLGCFLSNHGSKLAAKCFRQAFTIEPDLYEARFNLGLCLAAEEKHAQAINQFEKALSFDDDDQETRFHLALSLVSLKRFATAIRELLKIVRVDPNHDQAQYYLGQSYQEQGFLEEAEHAFAKAIVANSNNLDAVLSLASLLMRLERAKESRALLKRALSLDPKRTEEFIAHDEYLCHESRLSLKRNK